MPASVLQTALHDFQLSNYFVFPIRNQTAFIINRQKAAKSAR